jgi:hypothetical protein
MSKPETWKCPCGRRSPKDADKCRACGKYRGEDLVADLIAFLQQHGYRIEVTEHSWQPDAPEYHFSGKGVTGWFSHAGYPSERIAGRILADNAKAYNKWAQCPLCVSLPETRRDFQKLHGYLEFLGTKEAQTWSSRFDYLDDRRLPKEVS